MQRLEAFVACPDNVYQREQATPPELETKTSTETRNRKLLTEPDGSHSFEDTQNFIAGVARGRRRIDNTSRVIARCETLGGYSSWRSSKKAARDLFPTLQVLVSGQDESYGS